MSRNLTVGSSRNFVLALYIELLTCFVHNFFPPFVQDVAEPLMDLKEAVDEVQRNPTFKCILGTLLSVGNFLNGTKVGLGRFFSLQMHGKHFEILLTV